MGIWDLGINEGLEFGGWGCLVKVISRVDEYLRFWPYSSVIFFGTSRVNI